MKVLSVFGTRPEAIKMAPVVKELAARDGIESVVCVTGQHRHMLDQMLQFFDIKVDYDLDLMEPNQTLSSISQKTISRLEPVLKSVQPDCVLVQGDTTTAMMAALAAFYQKIPVGHVEAGLRTHNPYSPWPEEMNRRLVGNMAKWHFAPTSKSQANLVQENISANSIWMVGNTVIDALLAVVIRFDTDEILARAMQDQFSAIDFTKKVILVTGHRRENWGQGLINTCNALAELAKRDDVEIIYPVHLNPNVQQTVYDLLSGFDNIKLIDPLDYLPFVYLLSRCYMVITDSGGVQEEAPSLGKPVLVTRENTERPEGIDAGTAKLVGTNPKQLLVEAQKLLDSVDAYKAMSEACNPYGDGKASQKIVDVLEAGLVPKASKTPEKEAV